MKKQQHPFEKLSSILRMVNPLMPFGPLAAIWLKKPIVLERVIEGITHKQWTVRITEDDYITIQDGWIVDCLEQPTHKITACRGTATSDFELSIIDLKTRELSIHKII